MTDETEKYRNGRFADTVVLTIVRHTNSVYESIWTAYDGDQLVYFDHHCDDDRDFAIWRLLNEGYRLQFVTKAPEIKCIGFETKLKNNNPTPKTDPTASTMKRRVLDGSWIGDWRNRNCYNRDSFKPIPVTIWY